MEYDDRKHCTSCRQVTELTPTVYILLNKHCSSGIPFHAVPTRPIPAANPVRHAEPGMYNRQATGDGVVPRQRAWQVKARVRGGMGIGIGQAERRLACRGPRHGPPLPRLT